jgi:pyruvate-formate lyase-activating enzyme
MSSPKIKELDVSEVMEIVAKSADFISGITISGGEATRQLPFVIELFKRMKQDFLNSPIF